MYDQITIEVVFPSSPRRYRYLAPRNAGIRVGERVVVDSPSDGPVPVTVVEVHGEVRAIPGVRLKSILSVPHRTAPALEQSIIPGNVYLLSNSHPPGSCVIVEGFAPNAGVMGWIVFQGIARPMLMNRSEIGPPASFPGTFLKVPHYLYVNINYALVSLSIEASWLGKLANVSERFDREIQFPGEIWIAQLTIESDRTISGQDLCSEIFVQDLHGRQYQPMRGRALAAVSRLLQQPEQLSSFTQEGMFLFEQDATPGHLVFHLPSNQSVWELHARSR